MGDPADRLACPCCGRRGAFAEFDAYEICAACHWEDDPVQRSDPDYVGGANRESLNQARKTWLARRSGED